MGSGRRIVAVALALVLGGGCASTAAGVRSVRSTATSADDAQELAQDAEVTRGVLDNGLTYYVRHNERPGFEVQLRLVIDAGSVLEDPDQAGVAHFLEHMMFNGTDHYPKNELIDVLKGFGAAFGADINAYTSFDETVYELTVPNDEEAISTGIDVLHEWLTAASLNDDDVVGERGVVLDEWRQRGQNSDGRSQDAIDHLLFDGTTYEGRAPIGNDAAISAMTPDLLRRFYDRWYRPENAAIVIVGDIDPSTLEDQVHETFDSVVSRDPAPFERPVVRWSPPDAPEAAVLLDPDVTTADIEVMLPEPADGSAEARPTTVGDLRDGIETQIAFGIITTRLADDIRRGDLALVSADSGQVGYVRALDAPGAFVSGSPESAQVGLDALLQEFERAARFGFGEGEVQRQVDAVRSQVESAHDQRDTVQDVDYAATYVADFLSADGYPDADADYATSSAILDGLTAEGISARFADRWASRPPHVFVSAPESADGVPTTDDVIATIEALPSLELTAREDTAPTSGDELMARPESVKESSTDHIDGDGTFIDATVLHFDNGVDVVLNTNDITDDSVLLYGSSEGGLSLVDDADIPSARLATQVVPYSGLGELDPVDVDRLLGATLVNISPYLLPEEEAFYGDTSAADLETALAYIHQLMTDWHVDATALATTLDSERSYADSLDSDADLAGQVALDNARYGDSARFRTQLYDDELDQVTAEQIDAVWQERFGNANGWRFVLSGDFDVEEATELARAYLGTLAGGGATETYADVEPKPPSEAVRSEVNVGTGDRANITQMSTVERALTRQDQALADLLTSVLTSRLTETVREQLGASYSPYAGISLVLTPRTSMVLYVQVTGAPADMPEVERVLDEQLADIRASGPTQKEFDNAMEEIGRQYSFVSNDEIATVLMLQRTDEGAVDDYMSRGNVLNLLTIDDVGKLAAELLAPERAITVVVLPA